VSPTAEPDAPVAIICGSDSLVGAALVSRLGDERWRVVTIDQPGAAAHHAAEIRLHGPLAEPATWQALRERLRDHGVAPRAFIHAVSGYEGSDSPRGYRHTSQETAFCDLVEGAMLGCDHVMPVMTGGDKAIVFLTSVLAGWDTQAEMGGYSASQAGLLGLMRSLALSGGPHGIRVNGVAVGLVADDPDGQVVLPEVRGRIPLGQAASPDDIVDAIVFLLSPDASHITGSTLVVDGGQSLQSWSNAPRVGHFPQAQSAIAPNPLSRRTLTPNASPNALGEGLSAKSRATLPSPRSEGRRVGDEGFPERSAAGSCQRVERCSSSARIGRRRRPGCCP